MDAVATISSEDNGQTFEIPESCIGSAKDARETVTTLLKGEEIRAKNRSRINGMWNGNKPRPSLVGKGQADRANFTLREFEGFVAAAKTPYYALGTKAPRFISLTIDYGNADPGMLAEWAGKIATRYQYANEDDNSFDMHLQRSQVQMVVHGSGPMIWEDDTDWKATSRMTGQLLLPDDASADIEDWDTVGCPRSYYPTKLWNIVKNEKAAEARGWNVQAVKRAIMNAQPENIQSSLGSSWERYEQDIRKGATGFDSRSKKIFVADLFQKEFDNRISHFIILRENDGAIPGADIAKADDKDPSVGFLFRKIGRFECFSQIVAPFLYDVGPDGQWHSVKGAGPKIFDYCRASDLLTMGILDGAMHSTGFLIKAKDAKALSQTAITRIAGGTVVGPDYEVQQQRAFADLESPLLAKRDLQSTLQTNTGHYRQRVSEENQEPTLGQAQMNVQQQNVLGDDDASRYYRQLDSFHKERFRRLLAMGKKLFAKRKDIAPTDYENEPALTNSEQLALKFYRGCVQQDGIPEEIMEFDNFCRIKAMRLAGNGSAQMQDMIGDKLVSLLPVITNERGRNFVVRNRISSIAGETFADAIEPMYDTPQMNDSHISIATLENNALKVPNAEVAISPEQDHVVHFGVHLQSVAAHAQQVQGGQGDPHELLLHLEQAGPHTHEHLQAVASDPTRKEQVKGMQEAWLGMSKMTDQLAQQVQEADQAAADQQPQQAPDPTLIAALAKVHGELQIKGMKAKGDMALKAQKQQFQLRQSDLKTAHTIRLDNLRTLHDVETDTATARHGMKLDSVEAARKARQPESAAA